MPDAINISADCSFRPSELADIPRRWKVIQTVLEKILCDVAPGSRTRR